MSGPQEQITPSLISETKLNPSSPPQQSVITPTPKPKSPLIPILLTFLITSVLFIAGYFGYQQFISPSKELAPSPTPTTTPTPNPTADWQTYSNNTYRYQLKYPPILKHEEGEDGVESFQYPNDEAGISVFCYQENSDPLEIYGKITNKSKVTIANQEVSIITAIESINDQGTIIHAGPINNNEQQCKIAYSSGSNMSTKNNEAIFNQILSTFQFVDAQDSASSTQIEGYIRKIESSEGRYQITIDQAEWIKDSTAPNGYIIKNPLKDSVLIAVDPQATIIMQTYSYDTTTNNFNFNQTITQDKFAEYIQGLTEQNLFFTLELDPTTQAVTKITERYRP